MCVEAWQTDLLDWYRKHGRRLPWRATRDPYRVLVSEVMAQQTQVGRVADAYVRFVARYPTARALASAPLSDVLRAWAGLGYNRRARYLHEAAQEVVRCHDGLVPDDRADLEALPGVGPYTARAVRAFAFGRDSAPVDTNIARVLTRLAGERLSPAGLQRRADALVPPGAAASWSSALMDLGATHCLPRPRCGGCPLASPCRWRARGGDDPAERRTRTSSFTGSDRFHRGRLVAALRERPLPVADVAAAMHLSDDPARARTIADRVVRDGLAEWVEGRLQLPERALHAEG